MTYEINETHDPNLKSWVESANDPNTDFPIQNLPFCVFKRKDSNELYGTGVVIGDCIFDFERAIDTELDKSNYLIAKTYNLNEICEECSLSELTILRKKVQSLLREDIELVVRRRIEHCLVKLADAELISPF